MYLHCLGKTLPDYIYIEQQNLAKVSCQKIVTWVNLPKKKLTEKILKFTPELFLLLFFTYGFHMATLQKTFSLSLFRVRKFPQCFCHRGLVRNMSIISAVMKTKLNPLIFGEKKKTYHKLFCIWVKKTIVLYEKHQAFTSSYWDKVK